MFTCHEHIVELFTGAQVEIRYLSDFVPSQRVAEATPVPPPIAEIHAPEPDKQQNRKSRKRSRNRRSPSPCSTRTTTWPNRLTSTRKKTMNSETLPHVLQPSPLEFFLAPAEQPDDVAAAVAEYRVQDDEELVEVEEKSKQEAVAEAQPVRRHRMPQRFTWESPERWWDADRSDEAA